MIKSTYKNSEEKRKRREFLFSFFADKQLDKIIGLGGPDINDYISFCKSKGYNEIEIWENDFSIVCHQLRTLRANRVHLKFGNIGNAVPDDKNVLYDLDYCVSVRHMKEQIARFKNNFIMTFSTRIGVQETIDGFFNARNEHVIKETTNSVPIEHTIYTTNGGKYIFTKYFDTSAMCCFAKL